MSIRVINDWTKKYLMERKQARPAVDHKRKFPYRISLITDDTRVYTWDTEHKDAIKWLGKNIGERNELWYCNDAGWYYFKNEEDAIAFKLACD